jgi:hypothetical protein
LLRERAQAKTSAATTAITAITATLIHPPLCHAEKPSPVRSSSPDMTTAIPRERTQARTSTATTTAMATAWPIHWPFINAKTNVTASVARSSSPDTITAILPDRCPARAA